MFICISQVYKIEISSNFMIPFCTVNFIAGDSRLVLYDSLYYLVYPYGANFILLKCSLFLCHRFVCSDSQICVPYQLLLTFTISQIIMRRNKFVPRNNIMNNAEYTHPNVNDYDYLFSST